MRSSFTLFVAVSASLVSGCLGDWFNLQPDAPETTVEVPATRFPQCLAGDDAVDHQMFIDAKLEHEVPTAGLTIYEEAPVSPKGCIRWYQRTVDGHITSRGTVQARGQVEAFSELDGGVAFRESERYLSREDITPTSNRLEIDRDGDGFLESVMVGSFDEHGLVERVISFFSPSSGEVVERRTLRRIDADKIRWVEEKLVAGKLVVTRDVVAPAKMRASVSSTSISCLQPGEQHPVTCSTSEDLAIIKHFRDMLPKAQDCLRRGQGLSGNHQDVDLIEHMVKAMERTITRVCSEGGEYSAMMLGTDWTSSGGLTLDVNVAMFRCMDDNFIDSTMMHEMLHVTRGPHDVERDGLRDQMSEEAYAYVDPMRACEELCFGTIKTRCSCARCLNTQTCSAACSDLPGCAKKDFAGNYVMSDAVGAMCSAPSGAAVSTHWNSNIAACQSSCDGGTCTSYTLSCNNATCN